MKAAILSVLALITLAGCSVAAPSENVDSTGDSADALSSIADQPAAPARADGSQPTVQSVDVSNVHFDLAEFQDVHGKLDLSRLKLDVLDTGSDDHDYTHASSDEDLHWVESDSKHELPAIVDTIANGVDVDGGKCRISSISFKKIVVGCKWTF